MMQTRNYMMTASVFFCTMWWVCAGEVNGETRDVTYAAPAPTIKVAGNTVPESLFDESETIEVGASGQEDGPLPAGQTVSVGTLGQIELHVENQDVTKILKLLSLQSQRNIIASRNVAGTISADLYGVDFYEALEAILHANGFGYRQKGNFIYVFTSDELSTMQQDERRLVSAVRRLNYISAGEASNFVSPLLSAEGAISLNAEVTPGIQPTIGDVGENSFTFPDTLVIRDYQENVDEILKVIAELDVRPKQILIESTILDVKLNEDNAFGTDLNIVMDTSYLGFPDPLSAVDSVLSGAVPSGGSAFHPTQAHTGLVQSTPGNVQNGDATIKLGILSKNVSVFVRALDRVVDLSVIAKPKLTVLNRQKANLLVGAKLGYLSTTATETSTTQTVEFLEVGTQLTVRPHANDEGLIRMEIYPSVSDGSTSQVGAFVLPNETTSELITNVRARSGQTIVLGGLFKENTQTSRDQVPFLGDTPLIGNAFKGHDDTLERSEVIFLITPTILKDEAMYAAGEAGNDSVELAGIGAKTGLLPWSRSKVTAAHMREAIQQYEEGNLDRALFFTKMALHLDPNFIEARRLKERITQKRQRDLSRSILKNAVDVLVAEQERISEAPPAPPAPPVSPVAPASAVTTPVNTSPVQAAPIHVDPAPSHVSVPSTPAKVEPTYEQPAVVQPVRFVPIEAPDAMEPVAVEEVTEVEAPEADNTDGAGIAGLLRSKMKDVIHPGAVEGYEAPAPTEDIETPLADSGNEQAVEMNGPTVIVITQPSAKETEQVDEPEYETPIILNTPATSARQFAVIDQVKPEAKAKPSPRVITAVSRWLPGPQSRIVVNDAK